MAETTPLLSHASRPPHDHPIFLRVCHSPWRSLRQRGLLLVRTMIAVYLTTALALGVYYECKLAHRNARLYPFYASTVSLFIQLIYYWITALWTFEHLMGSRSRLPPDEQAKGVFLAHVQAAFSIPTSTSDTSKMAFSMFYTAAVTFPFVITITSWLYLSPIDDSIQASSVVPRAMQYFSIASSSVFNSVIAFSEIVALSSVRKQKPLAIHILGIIAVCIVYFWWAFVGRCFIDQYVYPRYFDPVQVGWRALFAMYFNTINLAVSVFLAQRGLHALRDTMAWKVECDRRR